MAQMKAILVPHLCLVTDHRISQWIESKNLKAPKKVSVLTITIHIVAYHEGLSQYILLRIMKAYHNTYCCSS